MTASPVDANVDIVDAARYVELASNYTALMVTDSWRRPWTA